MSKYRNPFWPLICPSPFAESFRMFPKYSIRRRQGTEPWGLSVHGAITSTNAGPTLNSSDNYQARGKNPKFVWYTYITDEWREREASDNV